MRIVTTNDFVGSFFPQPTSYGVLPGAAALQATIDDLRTEAGGGWWIDTGDLAQGSALGALSDGAWPFLALRELSIDVAVAGNHELDWGVDHLQRWSSELPFPLLAANLPFGLAATRTLAAGEHAVGVIGLSLPAMSALHPDVTTDPEPAALVARHSQELRRGGARHVVLALHDGVDPVPGSNVATQRMEAFCATVRGSVDLVLGGHTLACHAGSLAGVPFLQPWAFGSQVGVADLHSGGRIELRLTDVAQTRPWTGAGAATQAALEADVVGHLETPLRQAAGRDDALARAIADGLLRSDERIDWAFVGPGDVWNQPARDGVDAYLGAGAVSLAQVLRLTPLSGARSAWGGQLLAAELPAADAEAAIEAFTSGSRGAVARRHRREGAVTLALSPYNAAAAGRALRRKPDWRPIAATWRDALMAAVSR